MDPLPTPEATPNPYGPIVVLGGFDGCHLGHRELLQAAGEIATREHRALVAIVMDDLAEPTHLSPLQERCRMAVSNGAGAVHVVSVDSRADPLEADRVIDEVIRRVSPAMFVMALLPGDDDGARFPSIRAAIHRRRIPLHETDRWSAPDLVPVTSRGIASALRSGEVAAARVQLGRPYTLDGPVVHGSGLGRTIGFPTANVDPPPGRVLPANGVYAAMVMLAGGSRHRAAVNIGVRPTVEDHGSLLIEAHLLGFDGDLYDQTISIGFRLWLRGEQHFGSLDALVAQLARDAARAAIALR